MIKFITVIAAVLLLSVPTWANAGHQGSESVCGPADVNAEMLKEQYSEYPVARGINKNTHIFIQAFVSESGSWSLLKIDQKNNVSCLLASGHSWEVFEKPEHNSKMNFEGETQNWILPPEGPQI